MMPLKLQLTNFAPYLNAEFDFTNVPLSSLATERGPDESPAIDAITWAVWGRTCAASADELVHFEQKSVQVAFTFVQDGRAYRIIRGHALGRSSPYRFDLQVQTRAGQWYALKSSDDAATQQQIDRLVAMDYDTFMNSEFVRQRRLDPDILQIIPERKAVRDEVPGLRDLVEQEDRAHERIRAIEDEFRSLELRLEVIDAELARRPTADDQMVTGLRDAEVKVQQAQQAQRVLGLLDSQLSDILQRMAQAERALALIRKDLLAARQPLIGQPTVRLHDDLQAGIATQPMGNGRRPDGRAQPSAQAGPAAAAIALSTPNAVEAKIAKKPSRKRWASIAPALSSRNFRLFWIAQIVSTVGTALQGIAESYLIFQLTKSYALLGAFRVIALLPVIPLALLGGLVIDRFPRRKLIMFTQTGLMLQAAVFAVLIFSKQIQVWQIIVLDSIMAALFAIDQPARQTFLGDIVADEHLANAIALNATIFQIARAAGMVLGGVLIAAVSAGGAMALNALSYVAPLVALVLMRVKEHPREPRHAKLRTAFSAGFKTLLQQPALIGTIGFMAVIGGLATTMNLMMPAYAADILKTDAVGLGLLLGSNALGAVAGTLLLNRLGKRRRGYVLIASSLISAMLILAISALPTMLVTVALLFILGTFVLIVQALANTLVQLGVPLQVRGRVMSIYSMANAGAPMAGGVAIGLLSQAKGLPIAFAAIGAVMLLYTLGLNILQPSVRRQN